MGYPVGPYGYPVQQPARIVVPVPAVPLTVVSITSADHPYTVTTEDVVIVDATGGAVQVRPPASASATKQLTVIRHYADVSINTVSVASAVGDTIQGAASQTLAAGDSMVLTPDGGTDWLFT